MSCSIIYAVAAVVVQLFGTTITAVFADNTLDNQNNINPDGTAMDGKHILEIFLEGELYGCSAL